MFTSEVGWCIREPFKPDSMAIYNIFVKRSAFSSYRQYLSVQEARLVKLRIVEMLHPLAPRIRNLLDVGCSDGAATRYFSIALGLQTVFGIDVFPDKLREAHVNGVREYACEIEREAFPFPDGAFDCVIANQVFEHLKNIYHPLSEIHRVLKTNGYLLISVPNMASLHARLQLLAGVQPTSLRLFEEHVRGFTYGAFRKFLTFNDHFRLVSASGSGYYPFPPLLSRPLARLLPRSAVFQLFLLQKKESALPTWSEKIKMTSLQTRF